MVADDDQAVWCRADLSPLGVYMLTIEYDQDNVLALGRDELLEYVAVLNDALVRAIYTEGMRRQFRDQWNLADDVALPTVQEIRDSWPELRRFHPFEIRPCVSFEGNVSVQVWRGDQVVVQFAPHNVREHVNHAMQVYAVADLDASYRRYLLGVIGTDKARAAAAVATLGKHLEKY